MSDPYIGQIEIYGFSFAPYQWAFAGGQTIAIQQNAALYSLLGTTYGGNGTSTFQLPNLASRQACGSGQGPNLSSRQLGEPFGDFAVSLSQDEMPSHNHGMNVYLTADPKTVEPTASSAISVPGPDFRVYATAPGTAAAFNPTFVQPAGASQPHMNAQPYLGLNFSIALVGNFPAFD